MLKRCYNHEHTEFASSGDMFYPCSVASRDMCLSNVTGLSPLIHCLRRTGNTSDLIRGLGEEKTDTCPLSLFFGSELLTELQC